MLDPAMIREVFDYDPETGALTWRTLRPTRRRASSLAGSIHPQSSGHVYILVGYQGRSYRAHRIAYAWMTGQWPPALIDHIDGDGTNNRWANLRPATHAQNNANKSKNRSKAGLKGVSWYAARKCFRAQIVVGGRYIFLGYHATPQAAHAAYSAAAALHFGEFARAA